MCGLWVKPIWAPPGCVTLDKTLNLSEPQSITSLLPFPEPGGLSAFRVIVLISSIPQVQYTWPALHGLFPQSHPQVILRSSLTLVPATQQTPILFNFPPKYLRSRLFFRPPYFPVWVQALSSFSWVCAASSWLFPSFPLFHQSIPLRRFCYHLSKWKCGCVMCLPKTHSDCTRCKPPTPSHPMRQAHHRRAPATSSLSTTLPPAAPRLACACLVLPLSLCTCCSWGLAFPSFFILPLTFCLTPINPSGLGFGIIFGNPSLTTIPQDWNIGHPELLTHPVTAAVSLNCHCLLT